MYILGRQDSDFAMPPHRHNFDQIRLPLRGAMNHGRGIVVGEGEVGYFPEGLAYGPQEDPLDGAQPGERLQLVLQFGGAARYGFMSVEQRREAWAELGNRLVRRAVLRQTRRQRGNGDSTPCGSTCSESSSKYPRSRYKSPIIANPKCFNWLRLAGRRESSTNTWALSPKEVSGSK